MKLRPKKRLLDLIEEQQKSKKKDLGNLFVVLAIILFLLLTLVLATLVLPPQTELIGLQDQLQQARKQLEQAQQKEREAQQHLNWLNDPEYIEQIARDRADQAYPGEAVIRQEPGHQQAQEKAPTAR